MANSGKGPAFGTLISAAQQAKLKEQVAKKQKELKGSANKKAKPKASKSGTAAKKPLKSAVKKGVAKKKVSAAKDISKKYKDKGKYSSLDARRKMGG